MEYLKVKHIKDTFVLSNLPYKKFYASSLMLVGTVENNSEDVKLARGLIKFNLNKLEGKLVKKATLKLFIRKKQTCSDCGFPMILHVGINKEYVHIPSTTWIESPKFDIIGEATPIGASDIGKYVDVDLTNTFNKWLSGEVDNNGITLLLENANKDTIVSFSSTNGSKPPYIEYELA